MWWGSRIHFRPKDRASTRAHRRITTPEDVDDLASTPLGPKATTWHARKVSTRNKYLLLEQRTNEQGHKNQNEASKFCQDGEENGNLPTNLQQRGTEPSQSYYTFTKSFSTGRLRLRMKSVDRTNSVVGSSLKRGEVSLAEYVTLRSSVSLCRTSWTNLNTSKPSNNTHRPD